MESPGTRGFWLSPQQKRVWSVQSPDGFLRSVAMVEIQGEVNADRLRDALRTIVARHEVLRTVYRRQPGMTFPFQVVLEADEPAVETVDLRGIGTDEQAARVEKFGHQMEAQEPMPEAGPVLRSALLTLTPTRSVLVFSLPPLAADSRSLRILAREIGLELSGVGRDSTEEPLRYVQFAQWQSDVLESDDDPALEGRRFWAQRVNELSSPVLPQERRNPGNFAADVYSLTLPSATRAKLESVAVALGTSAGTVLLSAWQSLMWRLTGAQTFKVGTVFDGRQFQELQDAVGLFEKTLPLDARFDGDFRFREVVDHVASATTQASDWQEQFEPGKGFEEDTAVGFEYTEDAVTQAFGNLTFSVLHSTARTESFKLKLCTVQHDQELRVHFWYDGSRLTADTVKAFAGYFQTLLAAAIEDTELPVSRLPLLTAPERRQIVEGWNQTESAYPREQSIHELFEAQAARTPDRPALRFGDRHLTYCELNQQANQLAGYLGKLGVQPNSLVGLCVDRSAEMIVALLGILKAGAAYVPLNAENPAPRLAQQLAGAVGLITESKFAGQMPPFAGATLCIDRDAHLWADQPKENRRSGADPESLAYVIYTSGSTGVPKGVGVRHRNLVNYSQFITQRVGLAAHPEGLQFATVSTISADLGNTCIFPSLVSGGCLNVIPYEVATDAQSMAEYNGKFPIDVLKIVPSHLKALLHSEHGRNLLPRKYLIMGGETLTPDLIEQLSELAGECEILNHYGPTETTVGSLTLRVKEFDWKTTTAASIPIGRPIANTQIYILDKQMEPVPPGVVGELYIGGDGVASGYLNQPERTAERFVPNPFVNDAAARMYCTGDMARYLPDGNVEFLGRGDDQIKIRGFRIELGEIESVLAKRKGVKQAFVLAKEDERGDKRLVAYVAADSDQAGTADELRTFVREQLPEYMVPSAIVVLPKLPLTSNGKVDRQALPSPETVAPKVYVAPRTPTEAAIAKVWAEVLGREQVSVVDNFFDLGGHSLLAVQALGELEKVVGRRIPVASLFRGATVESLAQLLTEGTEAEPEPLVLELRGGHGTTPLFLIATPGVRAIGYAILARHINANQPLYKLQAQEPVVLQRPFLSSELETLSTEYLRALRSVQPHGPYYLGAMCGGCQITERMIMKLEADGEEVALFVVFDTWVTQFVHRRWRWKLFNYQQTLRTLRSASLEHNVARLTKAVRNRLHGLKRDKPTPEPWQQAYWPENFTPPHFKAKVLLFKRKKQPPYYINDPMMGWGSRTDGGVDVCAISTEKHRILREPIVQIISATLSKYLIGSGLPMLEPVEDLRAEATQTAVVASS